MKNGLVCQEDFYHKIWGVGDHYQKKRGMFFETSYVLVSGRSTRKKPSIVRYAFFYLTYCWDLGCEVTAVIE